MRKLLKPSDVLLLGLTGVLDVFEEVRDPFGITAQGCKALYGWVPARYRRHNFSRLLTRQLQTGEIEKVMKNDDVYLRLTSAGSEKIVRDFPMLSFIKKPWDRKWRVVIFDIAEVQRTTRNALRDKLRELGFGMLQESVWITPHDVGIDLREFLESKGLEDGAYVLEISAILAGDQESLVRKVWKLDDLQESYQRVIDEANDMQRMYRESGYRNQQQKDLQKLGNEKKVDQMRKIRQRYIETLMSDPCLPRELLPNEWPAEKARRVVQYLYKIGRE
ncbi:MAG: PaaX family transcriptional regulator C-terminal domain-containing protein [Candidatus Gottesmanbacteria bacterium]|nr:PaaX family transcriptional regulator C-terminal domain-containing protein [Candidatus Gottesmanbacteria bacterium]